jgi:hypothetical protein
MARNPSGRCHRRRHTLFVFGPCSRGIAIGSFHEAKHPGRSIEKRSLVLLWQIFGFNRDQSRGAPLTHPIALTGA